MPDARRGDQFQNGVGHAEAGPQDRHKANAFGDALTGALAQRRLHRTRFQPQIVHRLEKEQLRQLAHQRAELPRLRRPAAQQRQLVPHKRMAGDEGPINV